MCEDEGNNKQHTKYKCDPNSFSPFKNGKFLFCMKKLSCQMECQIMTGVEKWSWHDWPLCVRVVVAMTWLCMCMVLALHRGSLSVHGTECGCHKQVWSRAVVRSERSAGLRAWTWTGQDCSWKNLLSAVCKCVGLSRLSRKWLADVCCLGRWAALVGEWLTVWWKSVLES